MLRKNAPIGPRPAHRVFTESPAFKRWFGKSVLVREDGDPLVLFHGTSEDFSVFEKVGSTSLRPLGFWFADDPDDAEAFGDRLMPVYLRVENPYYANLGKMQEAAFGDKSWARSFREELIRKGHDGIIVRPKTEQVGRFTVREPMLVCVFDSRQVKSAIGNRGTYDPKDADILRNPRESVAQRLSRFEKYTVRTSVSERVMMGRDFLALGAHRFTEDEYVRMVNGALELNGRYGILGEPSDYPPPTGTLLKTLRERYAAERAKPVVIEVIQHGGYEATAYLGDDRYNRSEIGFAAAMDAKPEACEGDYQRLRAVYGDAPTYELMSSMIHPYFRGQGLGVRLYKALGEKLGRDAGAYLFANACGIGATSDSARRVYQSLGKVFPSEGLVLYFPPQTIRGNPTGRGGIGRRARLKIEFPHRSASSSLAAPTTKKKNVGALLAKAGSRAIPFVGEALMVVGGGKELYKAAKRHYKEGFDIKAIPTDLAKVGAGVVGVESFVPEYKRKPKKNPALRDTGTLAAVAVRDDEMVHITLYDTATRHDLMASLVGYAMVSEDGPGGTLISWQAAAQRGYGPMLYSLAAAVLGKPLHPSYTRSRAALAFWAKQPGGVVPVLSEDEFEKKFGVTTLELLRRANLSPREIRALQALGSSTAVDASYLEERGERSELPRDELMRLRATRPTPLRSRPSEEKLTKLASRLTKKSRPSRANPLVGFKRYEFPKGWETTRHEAVFRSASYERTWAEAVQNSPINFRVIVAGTNIHVRKFYEDIFDIDAQAKRNNEVVIVTGMRGQYSPFVIQGETARGTPRRVSRPSPFMVLHNLAEVVGFVRPLGHNFSIGMELDNVDTWAGRNGALTDDTQAQADLFAKYVMTGKFAYSGRHAKEALDIVVGTIKHLMENPGIYYMENSFSVNQPLSEEDMVSLQEDIEKFQLTNPSDLKGRSIPERYLAGLPPAVRKARVRELTRSRDAYKKGDYSELPSDRIARQMGLVKKSAYSEVAEARGIEWRGDEADMARRVCAHYKVKCTPAVATAIRSSFNKGLAAWKSGGHRPGATAQNWAVARVASLVVGGKTSLTADRKDFASFPAPLQKAIAAGRPEVVKALALQGRVEDARVVQGTH